MMSPWLSKQGYTCCFLKISNYFLAGGKITFKLTNGLELSSRRGMSVVGYTYLCRIFDELGFLAHHGTPGLPLHLFYWIDHRFHIPLSHLATFALDILFLSGGVFHLSNDNPFFGLLCGTAGIVCCLLVPGLGHSSLCFSPGIWLLSSGRIQGEFGWPQPSFLNNLAEVQPGGSEQVTMCHAAINVSDNHVVGL